MVREMSGFTDQVLTDHVGLCPMQLLLCIDCRQLHTSIMWIYVFVFGYWRSMCVCMYAFDLVGCELVMAGARSTGGTYQLQLIEQILPVTLNVWYSEHSTSTPFLARQASRGSQDKQL
jgi:hypothetical protein